MLNLLASSGSSDTTVQVAVITTIGLIIVAVISGFTAKITSGARNDARKNAANALESAGTAKTYAEALEERKAALELVESRLSRVEQHHRDCEERLLELERRLEEDEEAKRASYLIEREYREEIKRLTRALERARRDKG